MNKRKTKITVLAIILIALIAILVISFTGHTIKSETVKIGLIVPLTGDLAPYAEGVYNSVIMAVEESNLNIELIVEDDRGCNSKEAVTAAYKLIDIDTVNAIIGPCCSSPTLSVAPIVDQKKIVLISPSATSKLVTNAGNYVFRTIASDLDKSIAVSKYAYDQGYRKAAILYDVSADAQVQQKEEVKEYFEKYGGKIILEDSFSSTDKDFRTQLSKIKESDTDMLFLSSLVSETVLILRQAKEIGLNIQIINTDTSGANLIDFEKEISEGVIFPFATTPENKEYNSFILKYKERFGKDPMPFSIEGYDAAVLLIRAIEKSDKSNEDIKNKLYETGQNYYGASGIISFDNNGDVNKPLTIMQIRNNELIEIEKI